MKEKFTLEQEFMLQRAVLASYKKGDEFYWNFIDRFLEAYDNKDENALMELEKESYSWNIDCRGNYINNI